MHYVALATDFDGTIAHDGVVDESTQAALERLRTSGRHLVLVTGRELDDLRRVFPRLDLFNLIVVENGALLFDPAGGEETPLAPPPPAAFVERLRALNVNPLSVGRAIVASWEPNEGRVLQAIRELGLDLQITFNKGAVMVLPAGINKASGLHAALERLGLSPLNCIGVGDAENDLAFLDICGLCIAVSNAVPALRERADLMTAGARGAGVAELVDRMLATDLADIDTNVRRQRIRLAEWEDGKPEYLTPHRESLLLSGSSGGGKTTFTTGLLERVIGGGFQVCVIDPEGDYEGLHGTVGIGSTEQAPSIEQVLELLQKTRSGANVNLLGVAMADRPRFLNILLPQLIAERERTGRPHFIVVDEAHHLLPADWNPQAAVLTDDLQGFLFVTIHPERLSPRVLEAVKRLLVVGTSAGNAIHDFAQVQGVAVPAVEDALERGELLSYSPEDGVIQKLRVIPPEAAHRRHRRKYAQGRLGDDTSFWFRGPEEKLNLRAHNLMLFVQMAEGVDEETWEHHRKQGDYSRWMHEAIKDRDLGDEVAAIEQGDASAQESRRAVIEAVNRRYTLPE
jgi:hydroxymethylpyrimidine pyrophosphatase-like HAD family hydrolase